MAFEYDPKDASECLPAGTYDAELTKVEEGLSKAGNPMLTVTWVIPDRGKSFTIRDYITAPSSSSRGTIFKLKQIAKCFGAGAYFDDGTFNTEDYIGRVVTVEVEVEDFNGQDQNKIKKYKTGSLLPAKTGTSYVPPKSAEGSEEIPF